MQPKPSVMFSKKRFCREYKNLLELPLDGVRAHPVDDNFFEWHFAISGQQDTPFEGGVYHGEIVFPKDFPFHPPSIYLITPNGLFQCNSNLFICSIDWLPTNSVTSILTELSWAFTHPNDSSVPFSSTEVLTVDEQRGLAQKSAAFNLMDKTFCKYFPELIKVIKEECDQNSNVVPSAPLLIDMPMDQYDSQEMFNMFPN